MSNTTTPIISTVATEPKAAGQRLHELAEMKHNPGDIAASFRSGEYPIKQKSPNNLMKSTRENCK